VIIIYKKESTLHLVRRLRGGMMHVTSGRMDYCSVPDSSPVPQVKANVKIINVSYKGKTGAENKSVKVSSLCSFKELKKVIKMECDEEYFEKKTVVNLPSYIQQNLSKEALQRFTTALRIKKVESTKTQNHSTVNNTKVNNKQKPEAKKVIKKESEEEIQKPKPESKSTQTSKPANHEGSCTLI